MILIFFFFFSQNLVSDEIFISAEIGRNDPKYAEIFFFFLHCWRVGSVGAASKLCRSRVGAASARVGETKKKEKKKKKMKKKEDTRRTPESGESYPFRCPTPTRRQKWRVRAT